MKDGIEAPDDGFFFVVFEVRYSAHIESSVTHFMS
jgi:hypothetical protein